MAELNYARGWPPSSIDDSFGYLSAAERGYPFQARFREGLGARLKLYGRTGK